MARSVWKGPFVDGYLLKKADAARSSGRHEMIRIWSRRSTILPQFVGLTFGVYNGQKHIPVIVTEEMVGHKFGEFAPTRSFYGHSSDRKAKRSTSAPAAGGGAARLRHRPAADREARRSFMSKKERERALSDTEAKAVSRMLRVSPQKLNLLAQLIRGKKVSTALADLEFSRKRIARDVRKCLESAIANAENNHDLDVDDLVVAAGPCRQGAGDQAACAAGARPGGQRFSSRFPTSPSSCVRSRRRRINGRGQERTMGQKVNPIGLRLVCRSSANDFVARLNLGARFDQRVGHLHPFAGNQVGAFPAAQFESSVVLNVSGAAVHLMVFPATFAAEHS